MNILIDQLPTNIKTLAGNFNIKTNYKDWIEFEIKNKDCKTNENKIRLMIDMVDITSAVSEQELIDIIKKIQQFYSCDEESKGSSQREIFSFAKDQFMVYTDFIRFYELDLAQVGDMHWWKFKQLLMDLPEDAKTKKVMMYRSITIDSKMTQEQRSFYLKMKSIYSLKEKQTKGSIGATLFSAMKKG